MKQTSNKYMNYLVILLANALLAISYTYFVLPIDIISGGMGGVGIILKNLFGLDPTYVILILAWSLYFIGWVFLGTDFAIKTLLSTVAYPAFIFFFSWLHLIEPLSNNLLSTLYAGVIGGIGIGLSFRVGGSTGGFDIIAMLMQKFFQIRVERALFILDASVIAWGILVVGLENSLLGILLAFVAMVFIDKVVVGGATTYLVTIHTSKLTEVNEYILYKLERGSTLIPSEGGYTRETRYMIQTVVNKKEYSNLKESIRIIDPHAFLYVHMTQEVLGMGFKRLSGGGI